MSKVVKAKYKVSRRLGTSIWGDDKDAIHKKNYRPGQHGALGIVKKSDYGIHLKAKQRLKTHYGRVREQQFKASFKKADNMKGNTGQNFVALLERRLDAVVYRMNFSDSIFGARQLVSHKHIKVNDHIVNIASFSVKDSDVIELTDSAKQILPVIAAVKAMRRKVPTYLELDPASFKGKFLHEPQISDVPYPFDPDVRLIVEFYSK